MGKMGRLAKGIKQTNLAIRAGSDPILESAAVTLKLAQSTFESLTVAAGGKDGRADLLRAIAADLEKLRQRVLAALPATDKLN